MLDGNLEALLNDLEKSEIEIYFELQKVFEVKFGEDVVIFWSRGNLKACSDIQLGTFFEVYEVDNDDNQIGKAKEIAELLNIQLTKKNKNIVENSNNNPLLVSIPATNFEHYLKSLMAEQKYTVIVIEQKSTPLKISRHIAQIVSPGTNFDYVVDNDDNYIVSILVDKLRDIYTVGYSAIDVTTGKTWLYEICATDEDQTYSLDEVCNLLNIYRTSEVVITFLDGIDDQKYVMQYLEIPEHYHYFVNNQRVEIDLQNKLFKEAYQIQSLFSPIEHLDLEHIPMATESLAILMSFVAEHDCRIVEKMAMPRIIDNRRFMYLGNNALEQMGIISKDRKEFTLLKMLNKCSTAMGRRLLKERLLNPIMDKEELERRYDLIEKVSSHVRYLDEMMRGIYDIQRLSRRLSLGRLHPFEINHLYDSMVCVKELVQYVKKYKIQRTPFRESEIDEFLREIEKSIDLDVSRRLQNIFERRYALLFERVIAYVAGLDVGVSSSKIAQEHKYFRPMIVEAKEDENFMQIMQLRHPLIEVQERSDIYVSNDIVMGNRDYLDLPHPKTVMLDVPVHDGYDINGVLLYGINSSGKSSLMKSIGIAVLMAQSGFFVSAAVMKFSIFDSLFTRIVSKDSLAKGLSTFAVEMLELKNIFNRSTVRSLVLGDEISHGTETLSGVAIVAAAIQKLSNANCLFLFATHLHQLVTMQEITRLNNVVDLHLSVEYDNEADRLIFNRMLQAGSGSSIYGLEFAKSLHMDSEFLEIVNTIRKGLADVAVKKIEDDKQKGFVLNDW